MPGLVPGIDVFLCCGRKDVDGRDKPAMTMRRLLSERTLL
jgi:hypothetical protein